MGTTIRGHDCPICERGEMHVPYVRYDWENPNVGNSLACEECIRGETRSLLAVKNSPLPYRPCRVCGCFTHPFDPQHHVACPYYD